MSEKPTSEGNLADEFRRLKSNLISALQSARESPECRRLQDEIARGLSDLGETIGREAEELINSPTGQKIKTEVKGLGERIRNVENQEKIRAEILEALKTANKKIQQAINSRSESKTKTESDESRFPNQPLDRANS